MTRMLVIIWRPMQHPCKHKGAAQIPQKPGRGPCLQGRRGYAPAAAAVCPAAGRGPRSLSSGSRRLFGFGSYKIQPKQLEGAEQKCTEGWWSCSCMLHHVSLYILYIYVYIHVQSLAVLGAHESYC